MEAGRSWSVSIGERMLYGVFRNCFAIASVTVKEAVGAHLPRIASYCFESATKGCECPLVPARIVQP